jgi:Patatin-like phospholipase
MEFSKGAPEFVAQIFPAELEEICKRRRNRNIAPPRVAGKPSTSKGLIGLALSGGGIRSATFSLGVLQALIEEDKFKFIDYVSTVSGGGYIGSCLSSVLNYPRATEDCFRNVRGAEDPPTVKHLRNSSNYLTPGRMFDKLRLPAMLLRGIVLNLFLLIPSIILGVFLTEIINETWHEIDAVSVSPFAVTLPLVAMIYLFAFICRTFKWRFNWDRRNAYELSLSKLLALTIGVLALIPIFWLVRLCVDGWWGDSVKRFFDFTSVEGGLYKALFVVSGLAIFALVINTIQNLSKLSGVVLRCAIGVLGPLIIFSIYLVFCIIFIESPYFDKSYAEVLDRTATNQSCGNGSDNCQHRLNDLLTGKGFKAQGDNIRVQITAPEQTGGDAGGKSQEWKITFPAGNQDQVVIVKRTKGYLFIPELSIFDFLKQWNGPSMRGLADLDRRIHWQFYVAGVLIFLFNIVALDVNISSAHGFYRDRLSKAYLFQQHEDGSITSNDDQRLSALNQRDTIAPYHLLNTVLNLPGSNDPNLRGRNADFFTISKCFSGSEHTGYCRTAQIENLDSHFNLGTAMAISAAAAAPNMGAMTVKSYVFIMTMLNVRLGYWAPNPLMINNAKRRSRWAWPSVGPKYLLKEAFGKLGADDWYVNLSDGGHIENLAIYQLLKRRCKLIIAVDGEADGKFHFGGLVNLIRYADIDMGVNVEVELDGIRMNNNGLSKSHWALGTIHYGKGEEGNEEIGHLLYLKASVSGDENEYVKAYRQANPSYPHQTTADQFFDETQFEVYRALGEHIGRGALEDLAKRETGECGEVRQVLRLQDLDRD